MNRNRATLQKECARLDQAVDIFARMMKNKLHSKAAKGFHGWDDTTFEPIIKGKFIERAHRLHEGDNGQAVDVANLAMMLYMFDANKQGYFLVSCPKCKWIGMSNESAGGQAIADTGDYSDIICPLCVKNDGEPITLVEIKDAPEPDSHGDCICYTCAMAGHNGGDEQCACDGIPVFDAARCGSCKHKAACDVALHSELYPDATRGEETSK